MPRAYRTDDDHTTDDEPCYNCADCHGEGGYWVPFVEPDEWSKCPTCNGSGFEPKADA